MIWNLWKSYARTFKFLALFRWERTSGKGAMRSIVGSNFYCPILNSKSPLICIVGNQQKDHRPRSLNYCFFPNQRVSFVAMPFLAHKGFVLTGRLKTAKCECLWSRANCQVRIFLKQPNWRLQQLLAVEKLTILQQLKPSTFYIIFYLILIFYPHHTGMCSQMLYSNGSFEICQERMFVKQRRNVAWSIYLLPKKYLYSSKNHQISTWYVWTQ